MTLLCVNNQEHGSSHAELSGYAHHEAPITHCYSCLSEVQISYGATADGKQQQLTDHL